MAKVTSATTAAVRARAGADAGVGRVRPKHDVDARASKPKSATAAADKPLARPPPVRQPSAQPTHKAAQPTGGSTNLQTEWEAAAAEAVVKPLTGEQAKASAATGEALAAASAAGGGEGDAREVSRLRQMV